MRKPPPAHKSSTRDNWMVTYGSLLTGVLAFFLLLVGRSTSDAESIFKFSDNLTAYIGEQISAEKDRQGYEWLYVENTGNKGIKLLIPSTVEDRPMFQSGSGSIDPGFYSYLDGVVSILNRTDLPLVYEKYDRQIQQLKAYHSDIVLNVRIEGHTDPRNIRTEQFRDNWDLSTARAYDVMRYLQSRMQVPEEYFSMAGYAYFHPLRRVENYDENRRVEIYIKIDMVEMNGKS